MKLRLPGSDSPYFTKMMLAITASSRQAVYQYRPITGRGVDNAEM